MKSCFIDVEISFFVWFQRLVPVFVIESDWFGKYKRAFWSRNHVMINQQSAENSAKLIWMAKNGKDI